MVATKDSGFDNPTQASERGLNSTGASGRIDAEKLIIILVRKWPIILLCVIAGFFISTVLIKYLTPRYSAKTSILIKDTRYSSGMSETAVFEDLGILSPGRNLDNELQILKTSNLMEEVVKRLGLQYSYFNQGRIRSRDLYGNSPIKVVSWQPNDSSFNKVLELDFAFEKEGGIEIKYDGQSYSGQLGQAIKLPHGVLTIGTGPNFSSSGLDFEKKIFGNYKAGFFGCG